MLDPTDSDDLLPPAQPAEEIPAWLEDRRPEEESSPATTDANPDVPRAETLAEKHKARRQAFRRLEQLTSTDGQEALAAAKDEAGAAQDIGAQEAARVVETQDIASQVQTIASQDQTIASQDQPQDAASPQKLLLPDAAVETQDIASQNQTIASQDQTIASQDQKQGYVSLQDILSLDAAIEAQDIASQDQTIASQVQTIASQDQTQDIPSPQDIRTPITPPQESILQHVREWPRRAWQGAGALWARIPRRERPAPGEPESPKAQESSQPGGPGDQPSQRDKFKAGAARAWHSTRPFLWRGRIGPAFWTVASLLSLTVNIILIVILILLGRQLFFLKKTVVSDQLINGLYNNFVLMDQAHIQTTILVSDTIQVKDTIPVVFDLPLNQKTTVVLTKDTPVNTTIYLNNTAVPLDLVLRDGTELNIKLDMTVPVKQTIPVVLNVPVNLKVPVDIPLNQTQLHKPFVGLQHVVSPFRQLLGEVPDSWGTVCTGPLKFVCTVLKFK